MSIRRGKRAICIRTGSGGCDVLIRPRSRDYFFTGDGVRDMQSGYGYSKNWSRFIKDASL